MTDSRSKSEFNPDELARITHKGLHSLSRGDEPRCTLQQLSTLKCQQQEQDEKPAVAARRQLEQLMHSVSSALKGLFVGPAKKVYQCENYGHVLRPGWTGEFPVCADCGAQINTLSMVRGATLRPKDGLEDSGRWKRVN